MSDWVERNLIWVLLGVLAAVIAVVIGLAMYEEALDDEMQRAAENAIGPDAVCDEPDDGRMQCVSRGRAFVCVARGSRATCAVMVPVTPEVER